MVKITLTNQNSNSIYKTAQLDIVEQRYLINNDTLLSLDEFRELDFDHPLLTEPPLHSSTHLYNYCYDNLDELLKAPRQIYATLIRAEQPTTCQFDLFPSLHFSKLKAIYKIPFSFNYQKTAKEEISVNQLNNIISQFYGFKFQFQDKCFIKEQVSLKDLPPTVNGDLFYKKEELLQSTLYLPDDFTKFEIRYINHFIGFGVYCRQPIKQGEYVVLYAGQKKFTSQSMTYFFLKNMDSLNMGVDAKNYGNIARFINHAPLSKTSERSPYLTANLHAVGYNIYGIEIVVFFALRDIRLGEQLLIDYGEQYFEKMTLLRFKTNGHLVNAENEELKDSSEQKTAMLKLFAKNGIKQAIAKLVTRIIIIILSLLLGAFFLELFLK